MKGWKSGTACGPVEHCVRSIKNFIDAGVDHITIRPIGQNLDEQFRIYLQEDPSRPWVGRLKDL